MFRNNKHFRRTALNIIFHNPHVLRIRVGYQKSSHLSWVSGKARNSTNTPDCVSGLSARPCSPGRKVAWTVLSCLGHRPQPGVRHVHLTSDLPPSLPPHVKREDRISGRAPYLFLFSKIHFFSIFELYSPYNTEGLKLFNVYKLHS